MAGKKSSDEPTTHQPAKTGPTPAKANPAPKPRSLALREEPVAYTTVPRPSALVDTRVIYCGDNLEQLKKLPDACVDLVYIDPPFNSNRNYEVFWGETKEKRAFEDRHESTRAYIDWSEEKLRAIPPFEFENWAVIALGGIPNKVQVGDMGVDGRIYPVSSSATPRKKQEGELALKERWYPIQVKQKDKVGRPDIDSFEAMMMREDCEKGFFVSFDYSSDALQEIESFFKRSHKVIVALTVKEILEEQIARKLV
jgi:hypothetical protein